MVAVRGLVVLAALAACATQAYAQTGTIDVKESRGPSGTHFDLSPGTTNFLYEATISTDPPTDFTLRLKVYKNSTLKHNHLQTVVDPPPDYPYCRNINMTLWGLVQGDLITFHLKAWWVSDSSVMDEDYLYGDVVDGIRFQEETLPGGNPLLVMLDRRSRFETLFEDEVLA